MWTVVYIAPNRPVGEMIKQKLEKEGLLVMLRPISIQGEKEGGSGNFELLVPESEVEEAQEILGSSFGSR
ncbi:MAG: glutamate decarboxylase [Syntrophothermus sp.]